MATYREIVSMVLDELKLVSDDSTFTREHVIFLADKYRAFIIEQAIRQKRYYEVPDSNYQEICLSLERVSGPLACEGVLRSKEEIPTLMDAGLTKVYPVNWFYAAPIFNWVSMERFPYAGSSKWKDNFVYVSEGADSRVYLKSRNGFLDNLKKLKLYAVFYDSVAAAELSCKTTGKSCDALDSDFPIDDRYIPQLIQYLVNELGGKIYQPNDKINNASDDLAGIPTSGGSNQ